MHVNIEAERARKMFTKEEISKRLGISSKTYNAYVKGQPIPSDILMRMAEIFGCSIEYLLEVENHPPQAG